MKFLYSNINDERDNSFIVIRFYSQTYVHHHNEEKGEKREEQDELHKYKRHSPA